MSSRVYLLLPALCLAPLLFMAGCGGDEDADSNGDQSSNAESKENADGSSNDGSLTAKQKQAEALVQDTVKLIQERKFSKAISKLDDAIELDPECAEAFFQRAGILADAGQDRLALVDYTKTIQLAPKNVRYRNIRGLFLLTRKQLKAAENDFTAAIDADPKYIQAWNNRGLVKLSNAQYESAIEDFNAAVKLQPDYVDGINNRGFAWYQAEENEKALRDFTRALELNDRYVNAYNNRAMLFMRMKEHRRAIADLTAAIRLDENNPKHYRNRHLVWKELGDNDRAQADIDRVNWLIQLGRINTAIAQQPDNAEGYIQRAAHLATDGRHKVALANYEQALKVDPSSVAPLTSRARYWFDRGEFGNAIEDCTTALKLQGEADGTSSYEAMSLRGDAWAKLGRLDEAIADYQAAQRLDAAVAEAYLRRSELRRQAGNTNGADADLAEARRIDPTIQ